MLFTLRCISRPGTFFVTAQLYYMGLLRGDQCFEGVVGVLLCFVLFLADWLVGWLIGLYVNLVPLCLVFLQYS